MKATITDIAKALNITTSTVSRALGGSPRVKEETRRLVEKVSREMGYERNVLAANLRRGKSDIVGIIVPRINRQFFSNVISGAESVLNEAGYTVIICQTHEHFRDEVKALRTMRRNQVAGVLISHCVESKDGNHILRELSEDIHLVQFDRVFNNLRGAKIVNDNFGGAYQATRQLIEAGYKRIGTLAGYLNVQHFRDRLAGYKQALTDAGLPVDESLIFCDSIVRETGHDSAVKALKRGCDALYCAGDLSALGAIDAVKEAGSTVIGDIGIIGTANENFTGIIGMSSVEQHPKEMGQAAAQAFLSDSESKTHVIPMDLITRASSLRNNQE